MVIIYLQNVWRKFFKKSEGDEIFLFLLKHAFKTKTLHLFAWKKIDGYHVLMY